MRIFKNYISKSRLKGQNDILQEEVLQLQNINRSLRDDIHKLHNEIAYNSKSNKIKHLRADMILDNDMPVDFAKEKLSYTLAQMILKSDLAIIDITDDTSIAHGHRLLTMNVGIEER